VKSVQNQAVEDIEILIVGDDVDDATRAAAQALQSGDPRIRFFDLPKRTAPGRARPRSRAAAGAGPRHLLRHRRRPVASRPPLRQWRRRSNMPISSARCMSM